MNACWELVRRPPGPLGWLHSRTRGARLIAKDHMSLAAFMTHDISLLILLQSPSRVVLALLTQASDA